VQKRRFTIIISIVCFIIIAVISVLYLKDENIISVNNIFVDTSSYITQTDTSRSSFTTGDNRDENTNGTMSSLKEKYWEILLSEGAEYALPWQDGIHGPDNSSDVDIKVVSVKTTAKKTEYHALVHDDPAGNPNPYSEKQDNDGNLISNHSYIDMTVEMTNRGERPFSITLNRFVLTMQPDFSTYYEIRGYGPDNPEKRQEKDYFLVEFLPEEKHTFHFVYVVKNDDLEASENKVYLYASMKEPTDDPDRVIPIIEKTE